MAICHLSSPINLHTRIYIYSVLIHKYVCIIYIEIYQATTNEAASLNARCRFRRVFYRQVYACDVCADEYVSVCCNNTRSVIKCRYVCVCVCVEYRWKRNKKHTNIDRRFNCDVTYKTKNTCFAPCSRSSLYSTLYRTQDSFRLALSLSLTLI